MPDDLPEPDQAAAQQAHEAAARLEDEAASGLDRAAAHCRVAAERFRAAEVPRGTAHAWAALGHLREVEHRWRSRPGPTASRRASSGGASVPAVGLPEGLATILERLGIASRLSD